MTTETEHDDFIRRALQWRGVDDPCARCGGSGRIAYGSTATWRGGMGGQMITVDVCDSCWGSGDKTRVGVNLRRIEAEIERRVAAGAVDAIAKSVGAQFRECHAAIEAMATALEKLAKKRPIAVAYLPEFARNLADLLRRSTRLKED